jgi:hypothetical protein
MNVKKSPTEALPLYDREDWTAVVGEVALQLTSKSKSTNRNTVRSFTEAP